MQDDQDLERERRLGRLLARLPEKVQRMVERLRRPEARWVRIPVGVLLVLGGFLWILPFLGLWMLPLGIVLLSDDVRPLRRWTGRVLAWIEHRHPGWMAAEHGPGPG